MKVVNDTPYPRAVLLVRFWHPDLTNPDTRDKALASAHETREACFRLRQVRVCVRVFKRACVLLFLYLLRDCQVTRILPWPLCWYTSMVFTYTNVLFFFLSYSINSCRPSPALEVLNCMYAPLAPRLALHVAPQAATIGHLASGLKVLSK